MADSVIRVVAHAWLPWASGSGTLIKKNFVVSEKDYREPKSVLQIKIYNLDI